MDPVSQGVLGASAALAVSRRRETIVAVLCGVLSGMAPDLDALIRSDGDPLLYLEYHRQFTHSLVFIPIGGLLCALVLLASGVVLTRIEGVIVVKDQTLRALAYWAHVIAPLVCAWLFVLHRLAGKRIRWRIGARWAAVAARCLRSCRGWWRRTASCRREAPWVE